MIPVGQIEKRTQARIVALFQQRLGYDYLGDRTDLDNHNIETTLLTAWLLKQGVSDSLITPLELQFQQMSYDTCLIHDASLSMMAKLLQVANCTIAENIVVNYR